jgi:hypothetical protein
LQYVAKGPGCVKKLISAPRSDRTAGNLPG